MIKKIIIIVIILVITFSMGYREYMKLPSNLSDSDLITYIENEPLTTENITYTNRPNIDSISKILDSQNASISYIDYQKLKANLNPHIKNLEISYVKNNKSAIEWLNAQWRLISGNEKGDELFYVPDNSRKYIAKDLSFFLIESYNVTMVFGRSEGIIVKATIETNYWMQLQLLLNYIGVGSDSLEETTYTSATDLTNGKIIEEWLLLSNESIEKARLWEFLNANKPVEYYSLPFLNE